MQKTICIISAIFLPVTGGVQRYSFNLAKALAARGHRVIIVSCNTLGLAETETLDGIEVYRMPSLNAMNGRLPFIRRGAAWRRLKRQLEARPIDAVVVNTRIYTLALYGVRLARKKGVPLVTIDHSTAHMQMQNPLLNIAGHLYEHALTALMKRGNAFYGVSQNSANWLSHYGIRAAGVLYNAVDPGQIQALCAAAPRTLRAQHGIGEGEILVLFVGRLIPEKGVLKLAEAVARCSAAGTPMRLVAVGEGPLEAQLAARREVLFLGRVDFETVVSLLCQCDIYCLPTSYPEGFPTTLLEAAAAGCFCVTTPAGGSEELILNEEYGVILRQNTVEELAEALRSAAARPAYRHSAEQKAAALVERRFTWEATATALLAALEKGEP